MKFTKNNFLTKWFYLCSPYMPFSFFQFVEENTWFVKNIKACLKVLRYIAKEFAERILCIS